MDWELITPNQEGDWINPRNAAFSGYIPIGSKKENEANKSYFIPLYSRGLATARDSWCYNFNKSELIQYIGDSINFYNSQVDDFSTAKSQNKNLVAEDFISYNSTKFSWARQQKKDINNLKK
jgi:predicted helicase